MNHKSRTLLPRRRPEAMRGGAIRSMRSRQWTLAVMAGCVSASLALTGCSMIHDMHSSNPELHPPNAEHNEHSDHAALSLNNGNKWSTDEPLRESMQAIDELMIPIHATESDHLVDIEQGKVIAPKVRQQVNYMITHCELEPKADAALHVLIGDLLVGANELEVPETSPSGVARIDQVLTQYPRYFEHPGWPTPTESGS